MQLKNRTQKWLFPKWKQPQVKSINLLILKAGYFLFESYLQVLLLSKEQSYIFQYHTNIYIVYNNTCIILNYQNYHLYINN